jgi:hypothetical protein
MRNFFLTVPLLFNAIGPIAHKLFMPSEEYVFG